MLIRRLSAFLLTFALIAGCSSDDSPTDPGPPPGGTTLEVVVPDPVTSGRPFELKVTALDAAGTGPDPEFNGTIALSVSSGTVTPASVSLTGGVGSASVTIVSTAPSVELSFSHPSANSKIDVKCAQPGSVEVTVGRMIVTAGCSARTQSEDDGDDDRKDAAMPGAMSFSGSVSKEAQAQHLIPNTENEFLTATSSASADLVVTSSTNGGGANIRSLTMVASGSVNASFDGSVGQGSAGGAFSATTEFTFVVESVPVLAEVSGVFDNSFFAVSSDSGSRLMSTFDERSAVLDPGTYRFVARLSNEGILVQSGSNSASSSIDVTIAFTEMPPEE